MKTITRYAPSPTGKFHIGGARTALFNYLFSMKENGDFILRIDDTDVERNIEGAEFNQLNFLNWLGISPTIFPNKENDYIYKQSNRIDFYKKYIDILLSRGLAYKCFATKEELDEEREKQLVKGIKSPNLSNFCRSKKNDSQGRKMFVVRLEVKFNTIYEWDDIIRGNVKINSNDIGDWIISRSSGIPTYNFTTSIDDYLMKITHVLRGEEHITNTGKQLSIFDSFGWKIPTYVHLPIILNDKGKKLSKRDSGSSFIEDYKKRGFLPDAVINFLFLLGWSPKNNSEIFSKREMVEIFNLDNFSKSPAKFDEEKLKWINNKYINNLDENEYFEFLIPFIDEKIYKSIDKEKLEKIVNVFKPQLREGSEINDLISLFFKDFKANCVEESELNVKILNLLGERLDKLNESDFFEKIKSALNEARENSGLKNKDFFSGVRYLITCEESGPSLVDIFKLLGIVEIKRRIKEIKMVWQN